VKLLLAAGAVLLSASCLQQQAARSPKPPRPAVLLDPRSVDAEAIDELHRARTDAVCLIVPSALDLVQLCRDKDFDGVAFAAGADSATLRDQAERLGLKVFDSAGRRTTTGS
jgi:hypothetical protein